jgi:hypothetical protein
MLKIGYGCGPFLLAALVMTYTGKGSTPISCTGSFIPALTITNSFRMSALTCYKLAACLGMKDDLSVSEGNTDTLQPDTMAL